MAFDGGMERWQPREPLRKRNINGLRLVLVTGAALILTLGITTLMIWFLIHGMMGPAILTFAANLLIVIGAMVMVAVAPKTS
ncbi:MAG: hypothetical protein RLZZ324_387 [Candidatus Parcubacteria bacterium]|jgi:membrane protein YdbS with pleckstrin-like domain